MDTNVVSDYLSASFPPSGMQLMDGAIDNMAQIENRKLKVENSCAPYLNGKPSMCFLLFSIHY